MKTLLACIWFAAPFVLLALIATQTRAAETSIQFGRVITSPTLSTICAYDTSATRSCNPFLTVNDATHTMSVGSSSTGGMFTTLSASGVVSGAGFTALFASPPPIGSTTSNTGEFTSLDVTGNINSHPPGGFTKSFTSTQNLTGTSASINANSFVIAADIAAITANGFLNGLTISHTMGGPTMTGGRQSVLAHLAFAQPSSTSNLNRNYVALTADVAVNNDDNGTDTAAGSRGAFFAMNPHIVANSNATNLLGIWGAEVDIVAQAGSSMKYKFGWHIATLPTDAVHASDTEATFISTSTLGGIGWHNGLMFSDFQGVFPITTAGTAIMFDTRRNGPVAITNIIDASDITVSGDAFSLPGGFFRIAGNGNTVFNSGSYSTGLTVAGGFAVTSGTTTTGMFRLDTGTKTASATAGAATLNKSSGKITTEALTTAAGAFYTLTLTNSTIAAADTVFVSIANGTNTTGDPSVRLVKPNAGSVTITVKNDHTSAAFNGTLVISFASLES